jgi:hypothetical protein
VAESIEQLSFELTASALAEQERAAAGMRMCASTVIGAASVAGSFLGANAAHSALGAWSVLALISFGICVGSAIWVLGPHSFTFAFRGEAVLAAIGVEWERDMREPYRATGAWIEELVDDNAQKLADLSVWLRLSCAALAAEIVFWTLSVVG